MRALYLCQCVSVTVEQQRHGTAPQNGHGCNTRTTFDTTPGRSKLFIKQQQVCALSWSLRYCCNWILVFPVFRNGPRDFLIAFLPRVWPCEPWSREVWAHVAPSHQTAVRLGLSWELQGVPADLWSDTQNSFLTLGGGGWHFVSPWHPWCPRPPTPMHRILMCCAPAAAILSEYLEAQSVLCGSTPSEFQEPGRGWKIKVNVIKKRWIAGEQQPEWKKAAVKASVTGIQGFVTSFYGWCRQPLPWHHPISSNVTSDARVDILWLEMGVRVGGWTLSELYNTDKGKHVYCQVLLHFISWKIRTYFVPIYSPTEEPKSRNFTNKL